MEMIALMTMIVRPRVDKSGPTDIEHEVTTLHRFVGPPRV